MDFINENSYHNEIVDKIRNKSGEGGLELNLKKVWLTEGYSKESVKEYINHLFKELEYQKDSFKIQLKELMEEKEKLISEKSLLSQQLEEAVDLMNNANDDNESEMLINDLRNQVEESKKNMDDYYNLINKLRNQIIEADEEIKNLKNLYSNDDIIEQNKELIDEIAKLKSENDELKKNHEFAVEGFESNDLLNSKENYELLKMQTEENEKLIDEKKKLIEDIANISELLESAVSKEKEQNSNVLKISENFQNKIIEKNNIIEDLKSQVDNLNNQLIEEEEKNKNLNDKLNIAAECLSEQKDRIEYLETSTNVLMKQLDEQREKNRKISGISVPKNINNFFFDNND